MGIVTYGKTTVSPHFDSGFFKRSFATANEYLNSFWFDCNDDVWDSISLQIAVIIELEIKKRMKDKMNPESYEKEFANHAEKQTIKTRKTKSTAVPIDVKFVTDAKGRKE